MRYGIVGMVLGASILRATTGAACSPPRYSYSIDEFGPRADGVELNAPLLLTLRSHTNSADGTQELDPVLELQAAGSDSKLVLQPTQLGDVLSFVPTTPLEPSTTYHVSARLDAKVTEPSASVLVSWELTTGTQTRPSLAFAGDLKVAFEAGVDPVFDCEATPNLGSCGPECSKVGEQAVTKARISLPAVQGGFADEYLSGSVWISSAASTGDDGTLEVEQAPGLIAGEPGELIVTMPLVDGKVYQPCFVFEVSDARHDRLRSTQLCLDEAFPEPAEPTAEPEPEPDPEPEPQVDDATDLPNDTLGPNVPPGGEMPGAELAAEPDGAPRRTSSGCSTSRGSHGLGSALGLLLGLLAVSRRRQPKNEP
jgi:hypothetical protein